MSWELIENPAYAGEPPRRLVPVCHDGSPFLTIRCDCCADSHIHESQIPAVIFTSAPIAMRCSGCRRVLELGNVPREAFARMRADGWIGGDS